MQDARTALGAIQGAHQVQRVGEDPDRVHQQSLVDGWMRPADGDGLFGGRARAFVQKEEARTLGTGPPTPLGDYAVMAEYLALAGTYHGRIERAGADALEVNIYSVEADPEGWTWLGQRYRYLDVCKDRTIYYWDGEA